MNRRQLLKGSLALSAFFALPAAFIQNAAAALPDTARTIRLVNLHTGEKCAATYWEQGQYLPDALAALNNVLRDHRTGEVSRIDPALFDILVTLHKGVQSNAAFEIISGYRSPASNAMLHARSNGVATRSLHMDGKAVDMRLSDRPLATLRRTALAMKKGGVGYYPESNFVHVDTGRVRQW
ncbi:MAG: Twin-arginine translocation pathway signal [Alphaproteobacteria bacterium]|nr:Twin-arginine translocation pathway signal [Alphaproteobacteria bacterium]